MTENIVSCSTFPPNLLPVLETNKNKKKKYNIDST